MIENRVITVTRVWRIWRDFYAHPAIAARLPHTRVAHDFQRAGGGRRPVRDVLSPAPPRLSETALLNVAIGTGAALLQRGVRDTAGRKLRSAASVYWDLRLSSEAGYDFTASFPDRAAANGNDSAGPDRHALLGHCELSCGLASSALRSELVAAGDQSVSTRTSLRNAHRFLPIANDYLANWAQRSRWGLVWSRRSHRVQGSVITLAGLPDYKLAGLAVRLALNTHTTKTKGFAEAFEQQQTPASKLIQLGYKYLRCHPPKESAS